MNRTIKQHPLHDGGTRYEVRIEDEPCPKGGLASRFRTTDLLRLLASTPGLIDCGPVMFDTLRIYHDGERWVAVMEATTH